MRYPAMGKLPSRAVSIPALSGGVNLNDALNLVDDNQMTECKNVWYKDGLLQTRPALISDSDIIEESADNETEFYVSKSQMIFNEKNYKFFVKKDKTLNILQVFALAYGREIVITTKFEESTSMPEVEMFYTGKKTIGEGIYMLATEKDGLNNLYEMVTAVDGSKTFQKLTENDLYSPTIYINGKGRAYSSLPAATTTTYAPSSFFEGYNAIGESWSKFYFTTDGVSSGFDLPISSLENAYVYIEYNDPSDGTKYTFKPVQITASTPNHIKCDNGDFYVTFNMSHPAVDFAKYGPAPGGQGEEGYYNYPLSDSLNRITNNLLIKVKFPKQKTNLSGMRFGTWFGGAADGISGGTRFFVAGSKENPNLLMWSDLNNPTYFSENNEAAIGEETQSITALKKQSNMLVIFKEHELLYSVYSEGSSYTAEDVVAGRVVDTSTTSATFPMITIHSEIGCDLPESIQLCGDRLVWACKDKNVYMLKGTNQYSTANITKISDMCSRKLKRADFKNVKSCTCDGYYFLGLGNEIFVLNYDYYYFANLPSYSDSKKSQRKLIWYIWELPSFDAMISTFVSNGEYIKIINGHKSSDEVFITQAIFLEKDKVVAANINEYYDRYYADGGHGDMRTSVSTIESIFQTKLFDFGAMDRFKKIEQLYMGFGNTEGEVLLEYVTDKGSIDKGAIEITGDADEHSPQYVITKRFLPGVNRALRFGIRVTAKGKVAVDGILIKCKYLGVTR